MKFIAILLVFLSILSFGCSEESSVNYASAIPEKEADEKNVNNAQGKGWATKQVPIDNSTVIKAEQVQKKAAGTYKMAAKDKEYSKEIRRQHEMQSKSAHLKNAPQQNNLKEQTPQNLVSTIQTSKTVIETQQTKQPSWGSKNSEPNREQEAVSAGLQRLKIESISLEQRKVSIEEKQQEEHIPQITPPKASATVNSASQEDTVENQYSQDRKQETHHQKFPPTITKQIKEDAQLTLTTATNTPVENQETIVIKPSAKKKSLHDNSSIENNGESKQKSQQNDTPLTADKKEPSIVKKEAISLSESQQADKSTTLKQLQKRDNQEKVQFSTQQKVQRGPNKQEFQQKSEKLRDTLDENLANKKPPISEPKASQQIINKEPQAKKDNEYKIKIVPLEQPSNQADNNHKTLNEEQNVQKPLTTERQSKERIEMDDQAKQTPPVPKDEYKSTEKGEKHLKASSDAEVPKDKQNNRLEEDHQEKIQKLIQEVKNTKGELTPDSKQEIIKYLEAGKATAKSSEQAKKPMLRVQRGQHNEEDAKTQTVQPNSKSTKQPQQMDTTTIVFIIVLTFIISIPIVKQIRRVEAQEQKELEQKDKNILQVDKLEPDKIEDLIDCNSEVVNSSGYDTAQRLDEIFN